MPVGVAALIVSPTWMRWSAAQLRSTAISGPLRITRPSTTLKSYGDSLGSKPATHITREAPCTGLPWLSRRMKPAPTIAPVRCTPGVARDSRERVAGQQAAAYAER